MSDCSFLSGLTTLRRLELVDILLAECLCVSGLINLEALHLDNNNLPDCSSHADLSALYKLKRLYLQDNHLTDISTLTGLRSLQELNLQYNELGVDDYCSSWLWSAPITRVSRSFTIRARVRRWGISTSTAGSGPAILRCWRRRGRPFWGPMGGTTRTTSVSLVTAASIWRTCKGWPGTGCNAPGSATERWPRA